PARRRPAPARGLEPALAPRDWTRFSALRADCWSDAEQPLELRLSLADQRGYVWEAVRQLPPRSATTVEFDTAGALAARLDLTRLSSLELSADTSKFAARPVVYLDNLRFARRPAPVRGTRAGATASLSSTALAGASRTATGAAKR
ncbi:MAG: hypothetical protein AAB368_12860, partial [bacterium]